jgi:hypothetical protein
MTSADSVSRPVHRARAAPGSPCAASPRSRPGEKRQDRISTRPPSTASAELSAAAAAPPAAPSARSPTDRSVWSVEPDRSPRPSLAPSLRRAASRSAGPRRSGLSLDQGAGAPPRPPRPPRAPSSPDAARPGSLHDLRRLHRISATICRARARGRPQGRHREEHEPQRGQRPDRATGSRLATLSRTGITASEEDRRDQRHAGPAPAPAPPHRPAPRDHGEEHEPQVRPVRRDARGPRSGTCASPAMAAPSVVPASTAAPAGSATRASPLPFGPASPICNPDSPTA